MKWQLRANQRVVLSEWNFLLPQSDSLNKHQFLNLDDAIRWSHNLYMEAYPLGEHEWLYNDKYTYYLTSPQT